MIDRAEQARLFQSIASNCDVALTLMDDPAMTERGLEIELAGRAKYIAARLAQIEAALLKGEPHGKPDLATLHVLGDRGDAA